LKVDTMPDRPLLSIVCPAYREEEVLPRFHAALVRAIEPLAAEYEVEILYVDDGSTDGTLDVMRQLAADDSRVRYFSLSRNFGQQAALTAGLEQSRGDAVVSLDTDLQHPPRVIHDLVIQWRNGADVVHTIRADDPRLSWFKRTSSRLFYKVLSSCSDLDVRAGASDYRLLSRRAVDAVLRMQESHRYMRGIVQWLGFRSAEVPFEPDARGAGTSKYTLRRLIGLALDGLLSFSPAPYRLTVGLGLGATAFSAVLSIALVLTLVGWGEPAGRVGAIGLAALHIVAASILVAAGMLGEYVFRIYEQAKDRPNYLIGESNAIADVPAISLPVERRPSQAA
jgi:glycosyltransferase involved in cell wall biosynthesis